MAFPYSHLPDPPSAWIRARGEGRVREMSAADKILYLWKYLFRPKWHAPSDCMEHFALHQSWLKEQKGFPLPKADTSLCFLGDLMWIRKNWEGFLAPGSRELLEPGGLVGNLETLVSPSLPVRELLPDYFTFNSPAALLEAFSAKEGSLFSALSLANNHILDLGDGAARETRELVGRLGIAQSGIGEKGERSWAEFQRGGIRFGLYAATFGLNDPRLLDRSSLQLNWIPGLAPEREGHEPDIRGATEALREMAEARIDVKIIFLHWGFEFEAYPSARQMLLARRLVQCGADVVAGSHPHMQQPSEVLLVNGGSALQDDSGRARKALVLYSLGNFSTAMFRFRCRVSRVERVSFMRNENGSVDWGNLESRFFYNEPFRGGSRIVPLHDFLERHPRHRPEAEALLGHLGIASASCFR